MPNYPVIKLLPWEVMDAARVGAGRTVANWNRPDKPRYKEGKDAGRLEDDLTAGIKSVMCEIAVARHLNQYWGGGVWWTANGYRDYGRCADVGEDIEVRRSRTEGVKVDKDDAGKIVWGARVTNYEKGHVEVLGWVNADYVIDNFMRGTIDDHRYFPIEDLNPPGESMQWLKTNLSEGTPRGTSDAMVGVRDD